MAKRKSDSWKVHEPLVQYFERNDLAEVLSPIEPTKADVKISTREFIMSIDNNSAKNLTQIAKKKKTSATALLQHWLKEKIAENSFVNR